jgi:lysozyme
MTAREVLTKLVDIFEGKHLKAYLCPAGVWTIGRGAIGKDITRGTVWTDAQVEARFHNDATTYLIASKTLCPKTAGERHGAIADFAYNLGATRLAGSTLRKRINEGRYSEAVRELRKWVYGGGRKLRGLILRREAEASFFS